MNRRDFLKMSMAGGAAMGLGSPFTAKAAAKPRGKAKSVIQIWMWGGPCHIDTFDPKPDAGRDFCGPYDKTIGTNVDGIQLNPHLANLAKITDKFSIIRSMTHGINAHETASYRVQTGRTPGRHVFPSMGALVSLFKRKNYNGFLPPYIVLTKPQGRFSEAGFLGPKYKPFSTSGDPAKNPFEVEGIVAKGISEKRQYARKKLLGNLDSLGSAMKGNASFEEYDRKTEEAYQLMFGDAKRVFNLNNESKAVRERYGMNTFGQSCLMARRLVEQEVPYITINYKGWDTHKQHFQIMDRKLPEFDRGFSALLEDLDQRGLLDSTIVWCSGEFGRGPKVQWDAPWNGGRSHYGKCFSSVIAGGGFKGGHVIGSSDKYGYEVADRPVEPQDVLASMFTQLGIDPNSPLPNTIGLDLPLTIKSNTDGILTEIM